MDGSDTVHYLFDVVEPDRQSNVGDTLYTIYVSIFALIEKLRAKFPTRSDFELVSANYVINGRAFRYYFTQERADYTVYFLNSFNLLEVATFNAKTTARTKVTKQTAYANRRMSFYDEIAEKTYDVEIANLLSEEAELMEEVFTSSNVVLVDRPLTAEDDEFYIFKPMMITDCTCEAQDGDSELNKVKSMFKNKC